MKDSRPVNLDIGSIRLPITAYASITHRVSGVILVVCAFLMLWALDVSLSGPEGFAMLADLFGNPLVKFVIWGTSVALIYHSLAGIKHLIMDFGIGESLEGGVLGARIVIALTVVGAVLVGGGVW